MKKKKDLLIGFIGQGWIGKHYADDFEKRGYKTVRYALEEPYIHNGDRIRSADIVLVAVPTPTTTDGFDDSILRAALKHAGKGKTIVIKSTMLPGTTESVQEEYPDLFVMHSPEFLREATAAHDAANPKRNIIGLPIDNAEYRSRAEDVLAVLPKAPFEKICSAREAELIKYGGNCLLATKVIFMNLLHDVAAKHNLDWDTIKEAMIADKRLGSSHWQPVHPSSPGLPAGRGFGGHCFIKDFAAFRDMYEKYVKDEKGLKVLDGIVEKNIDLLTKSKKDIDLLKGVYGDEYITNLSE